MVCIGKGRSKDWNAHVAKRKGFRLIGACRSLSVVRPRFRLRCLAEVSNGFDRAGNDVRGEVRSGRTAELDRTAFSLDGATAEIKERKGVRWISVTKSS